MRSRFRSAGDEGAADRSASRPRADPSLCEGRRLAAVRRAARRARRRGPAGSARPSTGPCWKTSTRRSVHAVGRARCRQRRRGVAHHAARRRSMCRPASSARPGEKDPDKISSAPFRHAAPRASETTGQTSRAAAELIASDRMTVVQQPNSFRTGPDERGHFGIYGGRFVAETLMPLILELEQAYAAAKADPAFKREMDGHLKNYVGRPSPLYFAERLTAHFRRREDLFQARGPQPHRRAQGEQRARPDHAGQAHGQAARHRRDRRRHARRRDRDAVRQVRPGMRGVHGRGRRRRASSRTCCACRRSAPRCARSSPARRRSRTR